MIKSLGDRMKAYENQYTASQCLPYCPVIARIDGCHFHNFTKGLEKPFCQPLHEIFCKTTAHLLKETGAACGYTQSDEISLMFFQKEHKSQLYFDGKIFKLNSVLASIATRWFNDLFITNRKIPLTNILKKRATFDCRTFSLPSRSEVCNYFMWRQRDAVKNSIAGLAHSQFPPKALYNKNESDMQEMLFQKGINWNNTLSAFKRGSFIKRKLISIQTPEGEALRSKYFASYPTFCSTWMTEKLLFGDSMTELLQNAVKANEKRKDENIQTWAEGLAKDVSQLND